MNMGRCTGRHRITWENMRIDSTLLWHDILAAVLLKYSGKTLPLEIVVKRPPPESALSCDTVLVHSLDDGLHIKLITQKEAESYRQMGLSGWLR